MRTLLFDIDGTLLLTNGGGMAALELAIATEFAIDSPRMDVSFSGRTDHSLLGELLQRNDLPGDDAHRSRLRRRYTNLFPSVLSQRGGRVMPGADELLSRLADEPKVRSFVMTGNLEETATRKLEYFDLLRHIERVFGGDFDSDRDDLARRTADLIRDSDGEHATCDMIVIGDTPADIRCGHVIGADVVAVCTGWHSREELSAEKPMAVVDDFSDVSSVFALLVDDDPAHRHGRVLRGD